MKYTKEEVLEYIEQDDVKFIRLAFCDINGRQKNIAILPCELERAFNDGISFDASTIAGFGDLAVYDLFLYPIPSTLTVLPWRSFQGKVVRMFCEIRRSNGEIVAEDSRNFLAKAVARAEERKLDVKIGTEIEFYLFKTNEKGEPTKIPFDKAGYLDVAPIDKGENIRREICQTLMAMNIIPETSHHEEGPGQNEIDFRHSDPLTAADNVMNFKAVVRATAEKSGLCADFTPKPLPGESGNGLHINISVHGEKAEDDPLIQRQFMAGVLAHIKEITAYLNPTEDSYKRLGTHRAPKYITWSPENRSQLIRVPAVKREEYHRMELRSPDPYTNPYICFALLIHAGLDGIEKRMERPPAVNENLYTASGDITSKLERLPATLEEARKIAAESDFVKRVFGK